MLVTGIFVLLFSFLLFEQLIPIFVKVRGVHPEEAQFFASFTLLFALAGISEWMGAGAWLGALLAGYAFSGVPKARVGYIEKIRELGDAVFFPITLCWFGLNPLWVLNSTVLLLGAVGLGLKTAVGSPVISPVGVIVFTGVLSLGNYPLGIIGTVYSAFLLASCLSWVFGGDPWGNTRKH